MNKIAKCVATLGVMLAAPLAIAACSTGAQSPDQTLQANADFNTIRIQNDDSLSWNGTKVTFEQLATLLETTAAMNPQPQLEFAPDPRANYEISARVLQSVKESGVTNFGFVGNEKYRAIGSEVKLGN